MAIINSTESLISYIQGINFSSVYVEDNFPLLIPGTFRMRAADAAQYMLASAAVGNKVIGFFHRIPKILNDRSLRGICLFISMRLPDELETPVFFCREPEQMAEMFTRAMKVSTDTNMPVQIIITANVLNNYMTEPFPSGDLDRASPYLNGSTFTAGRELQSAQQKLMTAYSALCASMPQPAMPERIALELPAEAFPFYIFPMNIPDQRALFEGLKSISTTGADLPFMHKLIHILHDMDIELTPALIPEPAETKTYLCPGCPFAAIYATLPLKDVIVFTSVQCGAVKRAYPAEHVSMTEYLGIISRKLNAATLFIGNLSEALPIKNTLMENGTFILLNDCGEKAPFPQASNPSKLKELKNTTFPYSCNNIKKYPKVKSNLKKCVCYLNNESPGCADSSRCPALIRKADGMYINGKLCTGCRSCVSCCEKRALS